MRMAVAVASAIDAPEIATPESMPCAQRDFRRFLGSGIVRELILRVHLFLVRIRITVRLCITGQRDFEYADHPRASAGAEDADGEFAAGKKRFDDRRLVIPVDQITARRFE